MVYWLVGIVGIVGAAGIVSLKSLVSLAALPGVVGLVALECLLGLSFPFYPFYPMYHYGSGVVRAFGRAWHHCCHARSTYTQTLTVIHSLLIITWSDLGTRHVVHAFCLRACACVLVRGWACLPLQIAEGSTESVDIPVVMIQFADKKLLTQHSQVELKLVCFLH